MTRNQLELMDRREERKPCRMGINVGRITNVSEKMFTIISETLLAASR